MTRESAHGWRKRNPELYSASQKAYYEENKEIIRWRKVLKKYGITKERYEEILNAQDGKCGVCLEPPAVDEILVIDHCHKTLVVRGLLHFKCNLDLGVYERRKEQFIHYLKKVSNGSLNDT